MKFNKEKVIAIIVVIALCITIVIQARKLKGTFKKVQKPTIESRRLGNLGIYKWMTVEQISKKYGIKQKEVFMLLEIKPKIGDEKLDIRTLSKKYKKTPEQIKMSIKKMLLYGKDGKKL